MIRKEREMTKTKNIFAILGENISTKGYCSRDYWKWEQNIAEPKLEELGYTVHGWRTVEADSFGPLARAVEVEKDGKELSLFYG